MSFVLKEARLCMSTYVRALSPAKTEAGSDTSLLRPRPRYLWGGGRKQSQAYTGSAFACTSVRVRQCVYVSACARVSVCQCCTSACLPQETICKCKEYSFKVADIHMTRTHDAQRNRTHLFSNTHLNTDVKSNQTHILYI